MIRERTGFEELLYALGRTEACLDILYHHERIARAEGRFDDAAAHQESQTQLFASTTAELLRACSVLGLVILRENVYPECPETVVWRPAFEPPRDLAPFSEWAFVVLDNLPHADEFTSSVAALRRMAHRLRRTADLVDPDWKPCHVPTPGIDHP